MSDQLIPISIVIADRSYRIRIHPRDEEVVRHTIKIINDKVLEFKTQFAGKDMQDYVAMVLLWFATEQGQEGNRQLEDEHVKEKLNQLEKLIDTQL